MAGIFPALMTGYDDSGHISLPRTLDLVDTLAQARVHGLFVSGTAGEGPLQTLQERKELLIAVSAHLAGELPFIVQVGSSSFADTLDLATFAKEQGAADVCVLPPLYYDITPADIADYFIKLSGDLGTPVMMYHIPSLTHRQLSVDWYRDLVARGVLSGVKYSADNLAEAQALINLREVGPFALYSGSDPICLPARLAGSTGAVGVSMNVLPKTFTHMWEQALPAPAVDVVDAQLMVSRLVTHMFRFNFIAYLRHVLRLQGVDLGPNRVPLPNLTEAQTSEINTFLLAESDIREALEIPTSVLT